MTMLANANVLRSLAALLPHDRHGVGASLMHSVMCSVKAASVPVAALRDVALSCAAALQRYSFSATRAANYVRLTLLLACHRAGGAAAVRGDARAAQWLQHPRHAAGIADALASLLHGAACEDLQHGVACMSRRELAEDVTITGHLARRGRVPLMPNERSWRGLSVVELHVDAVCALAPHALTGGYHTVLVRTALRRLMHAHAQRFKDALSTSFPQQCESAAPESMLEDARTRCLQLLLRVDAASEGQLDLAAQIQAMLC